MRTSAVALVLASAAALSACGGGEPADAPAPAPVAAPTPDPLHMYTFDCGTIEVSDLDIFSSAGDYAGQSDVFADTCFLIRHPEGDLIWDLGLPGILAGAEPQEQGVFTVSLDQTLSDQLAALGLGAADIDYVSISHSHFDHAGQIDQVQGAIWLVHEAEYAAMFPPAAEDAEPADGSQFAAFEGFETETFTGEKDVFGDGTVVIFETPGHTPGHTSLQVTLPEAGPILLTGDLYHRAESRALGRVPRFNADETQTVASMEAFEARAEALGARVIIQHEPVDVNALPAPPDALR